jgi:cell wall assembly regulator SMI1
MDIENLWARLEKWASGNKPDMLTELNGPASSAELRLLEDELRLTLPPDFRASLLRHNGETELAGEGLAWADGGALLSSEKILEWWKSMLDLNESEPPTPDEETRSLIESGVIFVKGPVKPIGFSPRWIPFMERNSDVYWCVDLDPAQHGKEGQVIKVDPECCVWEVCAESYAAFFEQYVMDLENGMFEIDEDGYLTRT